VKRKYWYVSKEGDGWRVSEDWGTTRLSIGSGHADQSAAVERACARAQAHHNRTHLPTGVRVRGPDARWREEYSYGDE